MEAFNRVGRRDVLIGMAAASLIRPSAAEAQALDTNGIFNKAIGIFRKGANSNTSGRFRAFRDPGIPTSIMEAAAKEDPYELGRIKNAGGLISTFLEGKSNWLSVAVVFRNQTLPGYTIPENGQLCIDVIGAMANGDFANAWFGWPLKDLVGADGFKRAVNEISTLGYWGLGGRATFDGKEIKKDALGCRAPGQKILEGWTKIEANGSVSADYWIHKGVDGSQAGLEREIGSVMADLSCIFIGKGNSNAKIALGDQKRM